LVLSFSKKQTATTSHVMAVWYLSAHPAAGHLLPLRLRALTLLSARRIECSGLALLFLSFALIDFACGGHEICPD
jgi:hypothetical protein